MPFNVGYTPEPAPPIGLIVAIRDSLSYHVGRRHAVSRKDLLIEVNRTIQIDDRSLRACINFMRKQGELILSTGGENGGYWYAASAEEARTYTRAELRSRASDLLETAAAMENQIDQKWPQKLQPSLL